MKVISGDLIKLFRTGIFDELYLWLSERVDRD